METIQNNKRILIIDDNPLIHNDFKKILISSKKNNKEVNSIEKRLFGEKVVKNTMAKESYLLDFSFSGEQAIKMVKNAKKENNPYALAFVDIRMPPGWDGIETITRIWEVDPFIEVAICTGYSDYSWNEIVSRLGITDKIVIIKKPFEKIEIKQMATALIKKWNSVSRTRKYVKELENRLQKQINVISTIIEFANNLNTLKSLDEICTYIIEFILKLIKCERISIMLADEKKEYLSIIKSAGIPEDIAKNTMVKAGEGITGKVFLSEKILVVNNIEDSEYKKEYSPYNAFLSAPFICAPLVGNKITLGVINVTNKKGNTPFTDGDINIMSYISYIGAVAFNNHLNETKLEETFLGSIKALVGAIEAKDPYTKGHSERVSDLAKNIALELGFSKDDSKIIAFAGLVHDIGKIGIPESILNKPEELTPGEFEQIKKHPVIGEKILSDIKLADKVRDIVRHHHERLDGSGYPDGLTGKEISIESRIIAVADIFDAMKSDRPYRKGIPVERIKKELMESCGITLDFECVHALYRYISI